MHTLSRFVQKHLIYAHFCGFCAVFAIGFCLVFQHCMMLVETVFCFYEIHRFVFLAFCFVDPESLCCLKFCLVIEFFLWRGFDCFLINNFFVQSKKRKKKEKKKEKRKEPKE